MHNPPTILILISKHIMRRNILETEFWPNLLQQLPNAKIVLVGEQGGEEFYTQKFSHSNVEMCFVQKTRDTFWHRFVTFLIRTGTNSHGVTLYRERAFENGQAGWLITLCKSMISNIFGRFNFYKKFIRTIYSRLSKKWIVDIYDKYEPDMVFLPSLIDIEVDGIFGVIARRRGIRVVGMVRSWDNLSIHGLLPFVPDRFILQNKWLEESAELFQALDMSEIKHDIIGLPHYDTYFKPGALLHTKKDFFEKLGLDPNKRTIYFTGFDIYFSEALIPKLLNKAIEDGTLPDDIQVLFTRHPSSKIPLERYELETLTHVTYIDLFTDTKIKFQGSEEMFLNFVSHADVVVNVASTVAIDCAVLNKPVICVSFDDPSLKLGYWSLAERLFDSFDHYERLIATGGAYKANSTHDLLAQINKYLLNPNLDAEKREKVVELFVEPFDGQAGQRLVKKVVDELAVN